MSLLQMSFLGTVIILLIVVLRAVLISRLPKKTFLILWWIALIRLLVPFSIKSVTSIYSLFQSIYSAINPVRQMETTTFLPIHGNMPETANELSEVMLQRTETISILSVIWLAGLLLCFGFFAVSYIKCYREFRFSLPVENDILEAWKEKHPLKRSLSIRQIETIAAPLSYGVIRPVILMPKNTEWKNIYQLRYVLEHEYVHIRRLDMLTKLIMIAAVCIHWFNPLVWVMYILFKEYIVSVNRHISISEENRAECCELLKDAIIIGRRHDYLPTVVFIKYKEEFYVGIDTRYAEKFENFGYVMEERAAICIGCQILSITEKYYQLKVESRELIDYCLGLQPEEGMDAVVFSEDNILDLIYGLSIFKVVNNELEIDIDSLDDVLRVSVLLLIANSEKINPVYKETMEKLLSMICVRKICSNILDFLIIKDTRIKFLSLYQCIEFLFIPNRASEFVQKYNMNISDALKLHINEAMRRDERINALAILKIAGMPLIHKMYILLFNESEGDNELERINNWIYDKRCSIAHFRYGQQKNEETYVNEEILEMMLELLVGIFSNINQNMKDICSGLVKLEESTLA